MNDRGILASYLLTPLSIITNPENKSQYKLVKDPKSNRVSDLLIHNTTPFTLYKILLSFRDTDKKFVLQGDLLKMITKRNYNADHANLSGKKYENGKELNFDVKGPGNKSRRDISVIRLRNSPAIMASGISTIFLRRDSNELCDRLILLLQEKQAGKNSDIINQEIVAIFDQILD